MEVSFHSVSGLCRSSLAHWLPGGTQAQGTRRQPGSLALEVGELLVIDTFWVATCVVSSVTPTFRTAQHTKTRRPRAPARRLGWALALVMQRAPSTRRCGANLDEGGECGRLAQCGQLYMFFACPSISLTVNTLLGCLWWQVGKNSNWFMVEGSLSLSRSKKEGY